jgi:predicted anti-sigma-YlaC factor YlaD
MMHVEEGVLQAYLDDEVTAGARTDIDEHLQSCSACTDELTRLRQASQLFASAFRESDVVAPSVVAQTRLAEIRRFQPEFARPRPRRALARAAMFIVGLGAVASAAVPGSPVRAWLSDALTRAGLLEEPQSATAPPLPAPEATAAPEGTQQSTALAIDPVAGSVRIVLRNVSPTVSVSVQTVDQPRAVVEAAGAASKARFRTGVGLLEVDGIDGGSVVVQIPRGVTSATVERDGRIIFQSGR